MENIAGSGLAQVKQEGHTFNINTGESHKTTPEELADAREDKISRWIELHYDSEEDPSVIKSILETITQLIDAELIKGSMSKDDAYLLIKCLANRLVED